MSLQLVAQVRADGVTFWLALSSHTANRVTRTCTRYLTAAPSPVLDDVFAVISDGAGG